MSLLYSETTIAERVRVMGMQVSRDYDGVQSFGGLVLLGVAQAGIVLLADLSRAVTVPHETMIWSRSKGCQRDYLLQKHVLIVDGCVETGYTILDCLADLRPQPKSVAVAVLVNKTLNRRIPLEVKFQGFELKSDTFIFGYGMDKNGQFRGLRGVENDEKGELGKA